MKRLLICVLLALLAAALLLPAVASAVSESGWWDILPRPEWKAYKVIHTPKEMAWFEVHQIQPNVYAIYEPGNWQEVISYLCIGTDKAMLFDSGMNIGDMKQLTDWLTPLPVFVVNSHCHPDHTGCNYEYGDVWALNDPWARKLQAGWAHDDVAFFIDPASMSPLTPVPDTFDPLTWCIPPYTITRWLRAGDTIDLGTMKFEVMNTPGHSPDSISLLDRAHRLLLVGDWWYNGMLGCNDLSAYTKTAARLAAMVPAVDYILPSHNCTMIPSVWLTRTDEAFKAINAGTATDYVDYPDDGIRIYDFGYFQVIVSLWELRH